MKSISYKFIKEFEDESKKFKLTKKSNITNYVILHVLQQ